MKLISIFFFSGDICRVCRCEGADDRPLFHPCICTGSIKFIHQDCLLQWLKYSKKEFCELCSHRFSFTPIYSPDMPKRLPLRIIFRYVYCLYCYDMTKKFQAFDLSKGEKASSISSQCGSKISHFWSKTYVNKTKRGTE